MSEAIPTESYVRVVEETDQWAIVELMGHVKHAGRLTEEERFGSKIGRLDIPNAPDANCPACNGTGTVPASTVGEGQAAHACRTCDGFRTMFFGGCSVYRVQIVSEAVARHVANQTAAYLPVSPWDFPKQQAALPASSTESRDSVAAREPDAWETDTGGGEARHNEEETEDEEDDDEDQFAPAQPDPNYDLLSDF